MEPFDVRQNFSRQKKKEICFRAIFGYKKKEEKVKVWNLDPAWKLNHFLGEVRIKLQAKRGSQLYNQRKIRKGKNRKNSCKPKTMNATDRLVKGYLLRAPNLQTRAASKLMVGAAGETSGRGTKADEKDAPPT